MNAAAVVLAVVLAPGDAAPRMSGSAPVDDVVDDAAASADAAPSEVDATVVDDAIPAPTDDAQPEVVDDAGATEPLRPGTLGRPPAPRPRTAEPHPGVVGGYWDMDRTQGPEPDDGQDQIIAGSILVPLGIISVSSSAATVWLSEPGHCTERWAAVGGSPTKDQCRGVRIFGIIRITYGSLMAITGAVLLGIGTHRREQNRIWQRKQAFSPWFDRHSGGLAWSGRFGARRW